MSSLASNVDETGADKLEQADQARESTVESTAATEPTPEVEHRPMSKTDAVAFDRPNKSRSGLFRSRWFWGVVGIGVLVWGIGSVREGGGQLEWNPIQISPSAAPLLPTLEKSIPDVGASSQDNNQTLPTFEAMNSVTGGSSQDRTSTPTASSPMVSDLQFVRPSVGTNNVLSLVQIRWCLREDIRIETFRPLTTTNSQIEQFNAIVDDYNSRCGSFRYRQGTLSRAQREIDQVREQIVANSRPPWQSSIGTKIFDSDQTNSQPTIILSEQQTAADMSSLLDAARQEMQVSLDRSAETQQETNRGADRVTELNAELEASRRLIVELEASNLEAQQALEQARETAADSDVLLRIAQGMLASREDQLYESEQAAIEWQRQVTALNLQLKELQGRLLGLQSILDEANEHNRRKLEGKETQITTLEEQLTTTKANLETALQRVLQLEEAENQRLGRPNRELDKLRIEFLAKAQNYVEGKVSPHIEDNRIVFASENLFAIGQADLSEEGKTQIAGIVKLLLDLLDDSPKEINWLLRVDGHTDDQPITNQEQFSDNWELSQARSLSVVRFLINQLEFPEDRLAAAGFGEHRPINPGASAAARSKNRRIELKLTEP